MADHTRHSSLGLASPGRAAPIARPTWPWQPSSLHSSSSTSSSGSVDLRHSSLIADRSPMATTGSTPLPSTSSVRSRNIQNGKRCAFVRSDSLQPSTREWSFMGFEWEVTKVHKFRDYAEAEDPSRILELDDEDFHLLKLSPVIGDSKFKLEIAFTEGAEGASAVHDLSLYITCLAVDNAHPDYELQATMMAAITCQADRNGERGAPAETVWDFWQSDWTFRRDHEVWECPLPSLSSLLENERVRNTDSFVVCVQIHCPIAPAFPQQPSAYSVPRDLLEGLEASLDNSNTGDVRFVCLERRQEEEPSSNSQEPDSHTGAESDLTRSLSQSTTSFPPHTTVRKRIIYAHSDILTRRSEYFATMLASSFSENPILTSGERKIYTVVVEDAEFETIYWLLKYCYANWLLFRENDDPHTSMDSISTGWTSKWGRLAGGEWDWKTLQRDDGDSRSVTSGGAESAVSGDGQRSEPAPADVPETMANSSKASSSKSPTAPAPSSLSRRVVSSPSQTLLPLTTGSKSASRPTGKGIVIPVSSTSFVPSTRSGYPMSPRSARHQPVTSDPHLHPTAPPRPASALSMYRIAHRYAIPGLVNLALDHMMSTLTPQSSFALLLATSLWDELRAVVEDYVVEKWDEVSATEEFEQCCQEVAAGDWGSEGGKTLTSIFRRLRSPVNMSG